MNMVRPGKDLARALRQDRMRKLLEKIEMQFSLDYMDEAKATMEFAVSVSKEVYDEDVGYQLANLFYVVGNFKQALVILDQIQPREYQKLPRVLNLKGMCCMHLNKLKHASELFEMCILKDPEHVNGLNNLGNLAMHVKDFDKCKLYYAKSKESRPALFQKRTGSRTKPSPASIWPWPACRPMTASACSAR